MIENWMKFDINSFEGTKTKWYLLGFKNKDSAMGTLVRLATLLYQAEGNWIKMDEMFFETYCNDSGVEREYLETAINRLVSAKLFLLRENNSVTEFASIRVLEEVGKRKEHSEEFKEKKSKSGKLGAEKRWKDNNKLMAPDSTAMAKHGKAWQSMAPDSTAMASDSENGLDKIRIDKIRSDQIFIGVEAPPPEKKLEKSEIRKIITESLATAKLGKELDAITAQNNIQPTQTPSLVLKSGTALNVGDNFIDLDDQITCNQMFVSLGRRPLKKYPEIWITPLELKYVLDTAFDKKVEAKEIFLTVSNFVKEKLSLGEQLHRIKAVPALTGWGLQEALKLQTAEIRRDNQKNFNKPEPKNENNHYKNFKVYK